MAIPFVPSSKLATLAFQRITPESIKRVSSQRGRQRQREWAGREGGGGGKQPSRITPGSLPTKELGTRGKPFTHWAKQKRETRIWSLEVLLVRGWEAGRARRSGKKLASRAGAQSRTPRLPPHLLRSVGTRHAPGYSDSHQAAAQPTAAPCGPQTSPPSL